MDPYYKNNVSEIENDISAVLQNTVINSDASEDEVISEAIHLLSAYLN